MRPLLWLATAVAAAICVAGLSAQEKPDFSGEWTSTTDGRTALCGPQCTITQDATSLTITSMLVPGRQLKKTFILDGSERKVGSAVERAMWDGNKLRISIITDLASLGGVETVFSMNAGQMEVETSSTGGIFTLTPSKETYKKN